MRLTEKCKYCDKILEIVKSTKLGEVPLENGDTSIKELVTYKCGHSLVVTKINRREENLNLHNILETKKARPYQEDGVKFIRESDYNCIIGDQMRLGKTPQSLLALKNSYAEMTPTLILVKSANLWQWVHEYKDWVDLLPLGIFPIQSTNAFIPPGFSAYIMSMDSLRVEKLFNKLVNFGFKLVIADEAHSFKNQNSSRSEALVDLIKKGEIKHKILLTGTPVINKADEYFIPLNLVAPQKFPSIEHFRRKWLTQDGKGKWSRVNPFLINQFKEEIKPYVLRREKEDVYSDLPTLDRMFSIITIEDENLKKAYNHVLDEMAAKIGGKVSMMDVQGNLMLLRRICGLAKVKWAADYVDISLEDSEKSKIAIGIHHKDVRESLRYKCAAYNPLVLSGEDSPENKYRIMKNMEKDENRLLIINMLAGGVGMDFHHINNVLILERQWSSAMEEQFEFRFYNPDKSIKSVPTNVEYVLAKGTIDEWFYDLVEEKRQIFGETISNNWNLEDDPQSFRDLVEKTVMSRL